MKFANCALVVVTAFVAIVCIAAGPPPAADPAAEACLEHLRILHSALAAFEKDHGRLPNQLSDLYPRYVTDKSIFHCPADTTAGEPGRDFLHKDPRMPTSYDYEWSADDSNGLAAPLGPFPGGWGSCAHLMRRQMDFFGDQVPVVRCFHHHREYSEDANVLNLTRSGRIYRGGGIWEDDPGSFAVLIDRTDRDLRAGAAQFNKNWYLGPIDGYLYGKIFVYGRLEGDPYKSVRPKYLPFADDLVSAAPRLGAGRERMALRIAAKLYNAAGQYQKALDAIGQSIEMAAKEGDYSPTKWQRPIDDDATVLRDCYEGLGQTGQELALVTLMHGYKPTVDGPMLRLGELHQRIGNSQIANDWANEADPSQFLIGKIAPDFSLPDASGRAVSLAQLRSGRKAVLISFFFYGCGPCRAEAPSLQEIYAALGNKGLAVVSIDLADSAPKVRQFAAEYRLEFPLLIGGAQRDDHRDVFSQYHVPGYPTLFLVDSQGKIVWRHVGFNRDISKEIQLQLQRIGMK